ncbi:HK97 family phage prohead protease [Streptomyces bohaiensis]|uniref:HK97 family phage prohead protease n=2 Tax=Streptomyces bohaiensis TaxID=1431344 RepID=A0ABX1C4S4_9ACTN|nr:HK97 family phage prohead protease [Streptomyces bohaiensis]NJQ14219.1 HK97 family phage prohead protease [Streptomyces bohaiensis]
MRTKECKARVKAAGEADGLKDGQFRALVSVFGNEDSMGDVIRPGAFADVLAAWKASEDPIPVVWAHKWGDPMAHIGSVIEAKETDAGLEVLAQVQDMDSNPVAKQVHGLLKGRRITQFSFAYDVAEAGWIETDDLEKHPWGEYYEIRRMGALYEVGPCLVGANQETSLLAAKAADFAHRAKAGRVLSQANYDTLSSAHTAIGDVLAAAEPQKTARSGTGQQPRTAPAAAPTGAAAKAAGPLPAQVAAWATTNLMTTGGTR